MKKIFKSVYFWILVIIFLIIVSTFILVQLDLNDVRKKIPLTINFDWLSYLGSLIGVLTSLFVLLITLYNEKRLNKENIIDERKRTCYPFLIPNLTYYNMDLKPDKSCFNLSEFDNQCILLESTTDKGYVNGYMLCFTLNMKSLNDNIPSFFRVKNAMFTVASLNKVERIISPSIYTNDFFPVIINDVDNIFFPVNFIVDDKSVFDGKGKIVLEITVEYKSVLGVSSTCDYFYNIAFYEDKYCNTKENYINFEFEEKNNNFKHISVDYYE